MTILKLTDGTPPPPGPQGSRGWFYSKSKGRWVIRIAKRQPHFFTPTELFRFEKVDFGIRARHWTQTIKPDPDLLQPWIDYAAANQIENWNGVTRFPNAYELFINQNEPAKAYTRDDIGPTPGNVFNLLPGEPLPEFLVTSLSASMASPTGPFSVTVGTNLTGPTNNGRITFYISSRKTRSTNFPNPPLFNLAFRFINQFGDPNPRTYDLTDILLKYRPRLRTGQVLQIAARPLLSNTSWFGKLFFASCTVQ